MYLLILFIPLLSSLFLLSFGNKIGINGLRYIFTFLLVSIITISSLIVIECFFLNSIIIISLNNWIFNGSYISFIFDHNSSIMLFLVVFIFSIVSTYSWWYLHNDPFLLRFISCLIFFTFWMFFLVLSFNSLTMFIAWEGVGIFSFLLINFWFLINNANRSAVKAIIYNKFGDVFFMLAIVINFIYYSDINFLYSYINIDYFSINNILLLCFIIAAMAKSAQFFFDSWLGDAMMGPTPVSALLHAATMVTAGVYLLFRLLPTFEIPSFIIYFGSMIGILTIILGGLIAFSQFDYKKIIAYSTCSQLGFMFYSLFINLPSFSFFHLFIHGFFKALLFLSAGLLIHNLSNNQDSRKFSNLIFFFPFSYILFLAGSLSIISFPWISGFYSKEPILLFSYISPISYYVLSYIGTFLTVCYSFKLFYNSFFNKMTFFNRKFIHEESLLPSLIFLFIGSIWGGYLFYNVFSYHDENLFNTFNPFDSHFLPLHLLPLLLIPVASIFSYLYIINFNIHSVSLHIFNRRFFFDIIYNVLFYKLFMIRFFKSFDNALLDYNIKRLIFTK